MGAPEVASPLLGGRYRVQKLIGRGGTASVYQARDEFLGREVAVKVFRTSVNADKEFRRQQDEVNVLASLNHPGLVTLLDAAVDRTNPDEPRIYFVMELVEGSDLHEVLKGSALSTRQIGQIGHDLAECLEYIHARNVVHRDIKPANILLARSAVPGGRDFAKLTDFGIALQGESGEVEDDGRVSGTVAYLSPEQARGEAIGPESDIYALGLVLLECFTRELAFPGSPVESAMSRLQRGPDIPDSIPQEWRELLAAMTDRDAANRPNIHDLVIALRQAVSEASGRHKSAEPHDAPAAPADLDQATIPAPSIDELPFSEEARRLAAVARYDLVGPARDHAFDRLTALAARVLSVPIALVSIVGQDRVWFKSRHGVDISDIDREASLCARVILQDEPYIVANAHTDRRLQSTEFSAQPMQFYAGIPLRTKDGYNLGVLCVVDAAPRELTIGEVAILEDLAALIMRDLELRLEATLARSAAYSDAAKAVSGPGEISPLVAPLVELVETPVADLDPMAELSGDSRARVLELP